jgi:hypothetical protein
MRLASLFTWSVTVLLLLAARGSSTIQTPQGRFGLQGRYPRERVRPQGLRG